MNARTLTIVGASGAGRRVADIALDLLDQDSDLPYDVITVADDAPSADNLVKLAAAHLEYVGTVASWLTSAQPGHFTLGIGDSPTRRRLAHLIIRWGHTPVTLIAPTARVSRTSQVEPGAVISPGVDLSANTTIGAFTHVMTNAAVSHDTALGDFVNVNPGAVLAGNCTIGELATIGAGAVVIQGRSVGVGALVGASACVVNDVSPESIVKGVPAR